VVFQPGDHFIRNGCLEAGDFVGGEGDEEVGLDGAVDPRVHAGAEGIDHDRNTDRHGNGGHEGRGGERVAVHGADKVAHGDAPGGAAGQARCERGEDVSSGGGGGGNEEGKADNDEKSGGEPE